MNINYVQYLVSLLCVLLGTEGLLDIPNNKQRFEVLHFTQTEEKKKKGVRKKMSFVFWLMLSLCICTSIKSNMKAWLRYGDAL